MPDPEQAPPPNSPRKLVCAHCGVTFECRPAGGCWCAAEPYRLPLTATGASEDCLCPACLRLAAAFADSTLPPRSGGEGR